MKRKGFWNEFRILLALYVYMWSGIRIFYTPYFWIVLGIGILAGVALEFATGGFRRAG